MTGFGDATPGVGAPKMVLQTAADREWTPIPTESGGPATPTPTNATNATGEVVRSRPGGPPVIIERGPRWLADLAVNPPRWLLPAIGVVAVVILVAAIAGAVRHGEFDHALRRDLVQNGTTVVAAFGLAGLVRGLEAPFWLVAVVAGVGAWLVGQAIVRVADRVDGVDPG